MAVTLDTLPTEVLLVIFEYLDAKGIMRTTATSKFLSSLLELLPTWVVIMRVLCKDIPLSDPCTMREYNVSSLSKHLIQCATFHNAWASKTSDTVTLTIVQEITIPEEICMIRILPGCQYVVTIDLTETARFYSMSTGAEVGRQKFTEMSLPEIQYSLDFTLVSPSKLLWGLLTTDSLTQQNDTKKICVRAILVHCPVEGSLDRSLHFEQVLEHELRGSAEMLALSGPHIVVYSYLSRDDSSPTLLVWNWETATFIAQHRVPWMITNLDGGYAGHPGLHITPNSILLYGGQLGLHRIYAQLNRSSGWDYGHVEHVISSEEDAAFARFSSQGRCSRVWWGSNNERSWHRMVISPSTNGHEPRPIKVLTFEAPTGPGDTSARKLYTELGSHSLPSGFENSPQLYHISRHGTKAVWFSLNGDEMEVKGVSMPSFDQQLAGVEPSPIKRIIFDPELCVEDLRAFDTDETGPCFAFADVDTLWIMKIN